jgi:hypothetical protein
MTRAFYDKLFFSTMLPAIDAIINQRRRLHKSVIPRLFQVKPMTKSISQMLQMTGFGSPTKLTEKRSVSFDTMPPGPHTDFIADDFGLGYEVSHPLMRDDKHGLALEYAAQLARSMSYHRDVQPMRIYNLANSTTLLYSDGKKLCATDHPIYKGGGTYSNLMSASTFSQAAVELAVTQMELTPDATGKIIQLQARDVVIHTSLRFRAAEILKSVLRSDTTNNARNVVGDEGLQLISTAHLDPTVGWFVKAPTEDTRLYVLEREQPYRDQWYDNRRRCRMYATFYARAIGAADWRGLVLVPNS